MFFSSKTIDALVEDHRKIREQIHIMKDADLTITERNDGFVKLMSVLSSHTRREESAVYSFMKSTNQEELELRALEGFEEHRIVDRLADAMRLHTPFSKEWSAKAKVLAELIEHHLDEEESITFPLLKKKLNAETDRELCQKYEISGFERKIKPPPQNPTVGSPL